MFERPITKAMKAKMEAERLARLDAEYKEGIERQERERAAAVQAAQTKWKELIEALPNELDRLEQIVIRRMSDWEAKANSPVSWSEITDLACSENWQLRYNKYEKWTEREYYHYESSDGMRSGTDYEVITRECMPGTYWINPDDNTDSEWFVSRAESPDGPIPPVQYPYCTIAGDRNSSDRLGFPHDKARVYSKMQSLLNRKAYYQERLNEALAALTGTPQERAKYLLTITSIPESSMVHNPLHRAWRVINPIANEDLFWEELLGSL